MQDFKAGALSDAHKDAEAEIKQTADWISVIKLKPRRPPGLSSPSSLKAANPAAFTQ